MLHIVDANTEGLMPDEEGAKDPLKFAHEYRAWQHPDRQPDMNKWHIFKNAANTGSMAAALEVLSRSPSKASAWLSSERWLSWEPERPLPSRTRGQHHKRRHRPYLSIGKLIR
jgi:hypothetical protein